MFIPYVAYHFHDYEIISERNNELQNDMSPPSQNRSGYAFSILSSAENRVYIRSVNISRINLTPPVPGGIKSDYRGDWGQHDQPYPSTDYYFPVFWGVRRCIAGGYLYRPEKHPRHPFCTAAGISESL
jgi:hypothetical protein